MGYGLAVPHVDCSEQKVQGKPCPAAQKYTFRPNCQVRICDP